MRPQRADNFFCEVRLVRVPDETYGNDLWGVHEDPSDLNPLAAVALEKKDKQTSIYEKPPTFQERRNDVAVHRCNNSDVFDKTVCTSYLLDSFVGPLSCSPLVTVPRMTRLCAEVAVD